MPPLPVTHARYLTMRVPYQPPDMERARASFACHRTQFTPEEQQALFGLIRHFHPGAIALRPWHPEAAADDLFPPR
jgi:hypothetical protein